MPAKKPSLWKRLKGSASEITCYFAYSPKDGLYYAKTLKDSLAARGVVIFFDAYENATDQSWLEVLQDRLRHADALILVGTRACLLSEYTVRELEFARRWNLRILPIMFRGSSEFADVPTFLRDIHWLQEDESALFQGPSPMAVNQVLQALEMFRESAAFDIPKIKRPRLQSEEKRPLNEGKLILVGRGEVGKRPL